MNEKSRHVAKTVNNGEGLRHDRTRGLDKLVGLGRVLERLSSEDQTMKTRIVTANAELKDLKRRMFHDREMRGHLQLEKRDAEAYQKKIAEEVSQVRKQISQTKRHLE
jgi:predicted  nucleic acid-binding Zn-ribbon protein